MEACYDVAVIGAGIAGSAVSKLLAEQGWKTLLLDRRTFPRHKVCGEFLSPEALSMLEGLGVKPEIEARSPAILTNARLVPAQGKAVEIPLPGPAWGLSRYALDPLLQRAAVQAGTELQTGMSVADVQAGDGICSIAARSRNGSVSFRARTVIYACGSREGKQPAGEAPTYMGVKAHVAGLAPSGAVELYFFPGGYLGLNEVEGGVFNAAALIHPRAFQGTEGTAFSLLREAARRNRQLEERLARAEWLTETASACFPVRLSRRPVFWNRFAQVGDAALLLPPLCGDGMSVALRSALLCAGPAGRFLEGECTVGDWQTRYTEAMSSQIRRPLRWGNRLHAASERPLLPAVLFRLAGVSPWLASSLLKATRLKDLADG